MISHNHGNRISAIMVIFWVPELNFDISNCRSLVLLNVCNLYLYNIDCELEEKETIIFQAAVAGLTSRYLKTDPCLQALNQGSLKY